MPSTPLTHPPQPTVRKPAIKRRRLNNVDPGCQTTAARALADNSNVAPSSLSLPGTNKLSCSTCHRALSTLVRPGVAGPSMCSRCSAPTCAICARTCTSYTRPSSFPPTPALTRSPSPSTSHAPTPSSGSPKRTALTVSYAAMNGDTSMAVSPTYVPSMKRKKAPIDKGDADTNTDGVRPRDQYQILTTSGGTRDNNGLDDGSASVVFPGCGRVVCRACCVESVPNDGKLCVDCFALV